MTKTQELKKLIKSKLDETDGASYYNTAPADASFPYKVFTFQSVDLGDVAREDIIMAVDIWDKSNTPKAVEEIADKLEDILNGENLPTGGILPTIWRNARRSIQESDKSLQRVEVEFYIQNYKKGD